MYKIVMLSVCIVTLACNNEKNSTNSTASTTPQATKPTVTNPTDTTKLVEAVQPVTQIKTGEIGDTLYVTEKLVVAHNPNKKENDKMNSAGPDAAESLSDNLHYMDETRTNAKQMGLKIVTTEKDNIVFIGNNNKRTVWKRGANYESWGVIAFQPSLNPSKIQIVLSNESLKKYFK
jgi:hypothetical protein